LGLDFSILEETLPEKPIVKNGFVVNFVEFYKISEHNGLINLTMGSFNKPLSIFVKIEDGKATYFLDTPTPTSANHQAHNLIKDYFKRSLK
jgi:tRNA (guanine-N7-)-methyltransferase